MLKLHSRFGVISTILSLAMLAAAGCKKSSSSSPPPPAPSGPGAVSIASLTPVSGDISGGTTFTINGTGFLTGATVTFGGTSATITSVTGVQIIGTTPSTSTAGSVTVVVTNPDTGSATLTNGFTYTSGAAPAPTVTSIVPTYGPTGGSTTITVTGTGFQTGLTVTVGGVAATNITVTSAGTMTFDTPTGTTGSATIVITNPDTQSVTVTNGFSYGTPAPTVTSITPTSGPVAGGTTVTINGTGFQNSGTAQATVTIGGVACTNVQVLTAATIVCDTGASTAVGPQNVVVTNPDTQSGTLSNGYTYVGPTPTVTSISPTVGSQGGGTTITITGTNFYPGATVTVGGVTATITSVTSTQIIATTGAGGPNGPQNVVVTNLDGNSVTSSGGFVYQGPAPTITSLSPTSGSQGGGTLVTITGTNFRAGATVTFGGTAGTVSSVTATQIVVTTPSSATTGQVNVTVNNVDLTTVTQTNGYTYNTGPNITSIVPNNGAPAGGNTVTINGANFTLPITSVTFGSNTATIQGSPTTTQIIVTAPAGTVGTVTVTVTVSGGATATTSYTYNAAPTITSITPGNGPAAGGNVVTIAGTGFSNPVTSVTFGGAGATISSQTATQIVVTAPAGTVGAASVVVTNSDTQTASTTYTYNAGPNITGISPNNGPAAGGNLVTIAGTNFSNPVTSVTFGSNTATISSQSATQIIVTAPAGTAGAVTVTVTNTDTQTSTTTYTYNAAPTITSISPNNGIAAGGNLVTITGTNFSNPVTSVTFGSNGATISSQSATQIVVTAPAGTAGAVTVTVTNTDTQTSTTTYTYNAGPTITGISPATGTTAGGNLVTITGTNFSNPVTSVTFGSNGATISSQNATQIVVTAPAGSAGAATVTVTNTDTQTATTTYTYALPTITLINPSSGPTAGGNLVTITGTFFSNPVTSVTFGTNGATISTQSATQIVVTAPAGSAGAVTVTVTNSDSNTATTTYTYTAASPPTLTNVAPASGPETGGTTITLTGTNLTGATSVTVNGVAATSVTVVSATSVTAVTPAGTVGGPYTVAVTTPGGTATLTLAFTYLAVATQELTGQTDWDVQTSSNVDTATTPGSVVLNQTINGGFFSNGTKVTAIAYYHGDTTGNTLLVGTNSAGAFLTTDGGSTWTAFNLYTSAQLPSNRVTAVDFFSGGNGGNTFIIGTDAGAVLTTNGGTSFTLYDTASSPALPANFVEDIDFYDGNTTGTHFLLACNGGGAGGAVHTTDGGATFTVYNAASTPTVGGNQVRAVSFFDGDTTAGTFLVGTYSLFGGAPGIYRTVNGGTAFTRFHTGSTTAWPDNRVRALDYYNGNTTGDTWLVGYDNAFFGTGGIAFTTNTGTNVTAVNTGNTGTWADDDCISVSWSSSNQRFVVGHDNAGLSYTTNQGTGFTVIDTAATNPIADNFVAAVQWFQGSTTVFAVASGTKGGAAVVGGAEEVTAVGTSDTVTALTLSSPHDLPHDSIQDVAIYNDGTSQRILVGTTAGAALTTNGGTSWTWFTTTSTPSISSNDVRSVAWYEGNTTGTHFILGCAGGGVDFTTNGGTSFTNHATGGNPGTIPGNTVTSVAYFSGGTSTTTWLVGTTAGLAFTTAGTTTGYTRFTTASGQALPTNNVTGVAFYNGVTTGLTWIASCTGGGAGGLVHTTDAGATAGNWTLFDNNATGWTGTNNVTCCSFFDGNTTGTTFLAGTTGGVVRTTNTGTNWTTYTAAGGLPGNAVVDVNYFSGNTTGTHFAVAVDNQGFAFTTDGGSTFTVLDDTTNPRVPIADGRCVDYDDSVTTGANWLVGCQAAGATDQGGVLWSTGTAYSASGSITVGSVDGGVIPGAAAATPTFDDTLSRSVDFWNGNTTGTTFMLGGRYGAGITSNTGTSFITVSTSTTSSNVAIAESDVRDVAYYDGDTTASTWLIGTSKGAFLTTNGGTSYTHFHTGSTPALPDDDVLCVAICQSSTAALRFIIGTNQGGLARTNNGGGAFSVFDSTNGWLDTVQCVDYFDGDTTGGTWAVGGPTGSGFFKTTDDATTVINLTFNNGAPGSSNIRDLAYLNGDTTGQTVICAHGPSAGQSGASLSTNFSTRAATTWTLFNSTTVTGWPSNAVITVDYFNGTTNSTTVIVGHAAGISYSTNITGAPATWTHHSTTNGLPSNDVRRVAFLSGSGTANTWLVATEGGVARTANSGTNYNVFRRGTVSGYLRVDVVEVLPSGTSITYDIIDDATGTVISGYSGLTPTSGSIDISGINIGTYPVIRVRANLATTNSANTPELQQMQIVYQY